MIPKCISNKVSIILLLLIFIVEKFFLLFQQIDWKILYIAFALYMFLRYKKRSQIFFYSKSVNLYVFIIIICFLNTTINGYLPFSNAVKGYLLLSFICLYYPLSVLIQRVSLEKAENTIILMGLIASVISILQIKFGYNILGENFIGSRDGTLRLTLSVLLQQFAGILLFYRLSLVKGVARLKLLVLFFVLCFSIFTIAQTRSASFCYLVTMLFFFFKLYLQDRLKKTFGKKNLILLCIVLAIVGIYIGYNYVSVEIGNSIEANESSSVKRMYAYEYYWGLFKEYLIAGIGITEGTLNALSVSGVYDKLYKDDIGIIGFLAEFGLLGLLGLVYFINSVSRKLKQHPYLPHVIFSLQLLILLPFNCPLNIDTGIFYFALFLAMNNAICCKYK